MSVAPQIQTPQESTIRSSRSTERQRRNIRQAKNQKVLQRMSLALCCLIGFSAVWFVGMKQSSVYSVGFQNSDLQMQVKQQSAENASLNTDVDSLEKPSRILSVAIDELHMIYKSPVQIESTKYGK